MHNRLKRVASSLVTRLLLAGLVVLALGTVVTYFQLMRFQRDDLTQVVMARQQAIAQFVASDIDQALDERREFLQRLAQRTTPELLSRPDELASWLADHQVLQPLFSGGVAVFGTDGQPLGGVVPPATTETASAAIDPSFLRAREGNAAIGPPQPAADHGAVMLPIAVPVRDSAGRVVAVLVGRSRVSDRNLFGRVLHARISRSGGVVLVSPQDKRFLASTDPNMALGPTPPPGVNALYDRAMAGFRGAGLMVDAAGVEELTAVASVPSTGWFVVARLPTSEALATLGRTSNFLLQQRLPVMLGVLALIGIGAMWLLRPLRRAAEQADRMARGELPLTPLPVVRDDELGRLTAAFNRLLAKLEVQGAELRLQAHYDSLTGLPNRKLLADRLAQALARARRDGKRVGVLFLDLDGFKRINDSLGHEAGDVVLQQVAHRLTAVVRESDTVARLGGDEFVLLAADFDGNGGGDTNATALAQKCIEAIAQPLHVLGTTQRIGVSVGIALSDENATSASLLAASDRAMYVVKQRGSAGFSVDRATA